MKQSRRKQDAHLTETRQSPGPIRPERQRRPREDQQGEKLQLLCRLENWMAVLQRPRGSPQAASSSLTSQVANFTKANELEHISVFWKEFLKIDGECRQDTRSQCTFVQNSLFTSAERTPRAWLKLNSYGLQYHVGDLSSGVAHVSPYDVLSPAFHHEHIIFFILSSFYDTRTRSTASRTRFIPRTPNTSCTSPISLSWQAAPSKNHPGVKTCRVAENRARQLQQKQISAQLESHGMGLG